MRKPLAVACIALFLLSATTILASSFKQAIAADQGIVIQGADYNSTIVTAYSSGLVSVAGNVTQRIVMEYADLNLERGLIASNDLNSEAALVTRRITVEYADYLSTNGFVTYLGPNNGSFAILPSIDSITRIPSGNVSDNQSVIVSATVSDAGSGVQNATLQYNLNNGTEWVNVPMDLNLTVYPKDSLLLSYFGMVLGQPYDTYVRFRIVAWDYHGNNATRNGVAYSVEDLTPPDIGDPTQEPPANNVTQNQNVTVSVNITDAESGVKNATLEYRINSTSSWNSTVMGYNSTSSLYYATIPGQPNGTHVTYEIMAYDNAGNLGVNDNATQYYSYTVVPEFPSAMILLLFMIATLFVVTAYKKKHFQSMRGKDRK
jgi:hypothetical protein